MEKESGRHTSGCCVYTKNPCWYRPEMELFLFYGVYRVVKRLRTENKHVLRYEKARLQVVETIDRRANHSDVRQRFYMLVFEKKTNVIRKSR